MRVLVPANPGCPGNKGHQTVVVVRTTRVVYESSGAS